MSRPVASLPSAARALALVTALLTALVTATAAHAVTQLPAAASTGGPRSIPAVVTVTLGAHALGDGTYRLSGVVRPARVGLPVTLARLQGSRSVGVAGTRTDSRGGYTFSQRLAPGTTTAFQVLTPAAAGVQAGRSIVYGIAAPSPVPVRCRSVAPSGQALARLVVPPRLPARAPVRPGSPAALLRRALLSVNRYALTTLYRGRALDPADRRPPTDGPRSSGAEALALASTLSTGAYDPGVAGASAQRARAVAVWLVGAQACGHAAVSPGGWGAAGGGAPVPTDLHAWMSPLAAALVGHAGWLLWPGLPDVDRRNVAAMVAAEADLLLRVAPGYMARPDGRVLSPGDTKAEEDAWMTNVLGLASAMMPAHPQAAAWRRQEAAFQIAAFSTAADAVSPLVVNGRPLREWLAGWNVAADGTVVNHGIDPHPDYMATASFNVFAAAVDALAGRPTLRTAVRGAARVYSSLLDRRFPSPPYAAPGGTVYRRGSALLYYPVASDWGTSLRAHVVGLDAAAAVLGVSGEAPAFLRLHAQALLDMQARSPDGRTYRSWDEYRYVGREQWVAEQLGRAWLVVWAADGGRARLPITDAPLG